MNDMQTLQEAVREQIRHTVMAAVPKESIDKIVADYFENEFKKFVNKEIELVLNEKFKKAIFDEGQLAWNRSGQQQVVNVSREVAEAIMQGFASSIIQTVTNQMKNVISLMR